MGEVVNLRRIRKERARTEAAQTAAESRALHGRTKGEKARDQATAEALRSHLEAHKREEPD